jgi:pimeloyl-ACP methyl ester carboxylesterase
MEPADAELEWDAGFPRRRVAVNEIELSFIDTGEGPAVLLLHGWPDSALLWRFQIPALTAAGLRVIAPDLRGFGESSKPEDVAAYRVRESMRDMAALLDVLELDRVSLVGHDWGAPVAWLLATFLAERVERLAVLSVGHPDVFGASDDGNPPLEHLRRQWYSLLFQFEGVAEQWLSDDDWRRFRALVAPARDVDRYIADLSRPGALTASLKWYRANSSARRLLGRASGALPPVPAHVAVLGLWSDGDPYLIEDQMRGSGRCVTGTWRYECVADAGHWLQLDRPEVVNELLVGHLVGPGPTKRAQEPRHSLGPERTA